MYKIINICFYFSFTAFLNAGQYGGGAGAPEDPYQIYTAEHLLELGNTTSDYEANFILMADIDMAGQTYTQAIIAPDLDDETWGLQGTSFPGTFDGNGHKILNLSLENLNKSYMALFGRVKKSGCIKNLHMENAQVAGYSSSACLVGSLLGKLQDCSVTGNISGKYAAGGLVGFLDYGSIINSFCQVTIYLEPPGRRASAHCVGGLVGFINFGAVDNCFSKVTLISEVNIHNVGGFVGINSNGNISNSFCADVIIKSNNPWVGNIGAFCGQNGGSIQNSLATDFNIECLAMHKSDSIGGLVGSNSSLIAKSVAEGSVTGKSNVGGIAGKNSGYIIDCYSNVTTSAEDKVGAFAGHNTYGILRSYSLGQALASLVQAGGFAGENIGIIDLCFFDAELSGIVTDCDAIAKRTAELKQRATYKCWGDGVWVIDPDGDYPRLAWENTPGIVITDEPREYGGGSGSEDDPFLIFSPEHLVQIGLYPQDLSKHYKLMADIDLTNCNFNGIGVAFGFGGVFDGNGHVIKNYSINNELKHAGLFTVILQSGVVKNLTVEAFNLSGTDCVGGLCGKNEGKIENCQVFGTIYALPTKEKNSFWGGLVGRNSGIIENCQAGVDLQISRDGIKDLGGFAGLNSRRIQRCGSIGQIVITGKDNHNIGGFVGRGAYDSKIHNCYTQMAIKVTGDSCSSVGGFLGGQDYRTVTNFSYCSSPMEIAEDCQQVGAFIGYSGTPPPRASNSRILHCFWNMNVEAPKEAVGKLYPSKLVLMPASNEQLTDLDFLRKAGWDIGPPQQEKIWVLTQGELPRCNR